MELAPIDPTESFVLVKLESDATGRSRFRQIHQPLAERDPKLFISKRMSKGGAVEWRQTSPGYQSEFQCPPTPRWTFVLSGQLEVLLPDGTHRLFKQGDHFYATDVLPEGVAFEPTIHGHRIRTIGRDIAITALVSE